MTNDVEYESRRTVEMVRLAINAVRSELPQPAIKLASEFVDADEYELALETIVDCLSENDCAISQEQYAMILDAARRLEIESILTAKAREPGYQTIWKLLRDRRFNK